MTPLQRSLKDNLQGHPTIRRVLRVDVQVAPKSSTRTTRRANLEGEPAGGCWDPRVAL